MSASINISSGKEETEKFRLWFMRKLLMGMTWP
jgi:hypothetical protein